ncbi:NUDIX hydrolase [Anaerosolibacter sp.]|uniref:NUDIX hydrolase n=1 Tax=Anaerosolibacter sp. TaxID=1872527 RepID=UPI0039EE45DF
MKKIYFAVKGFIVKEGKFLAMHQRTANEPWFDLPGGRMEFGETAEETLIREVHEETGLTVKPIKLLDTWNYITEDYQITGIIYSCEIDKGEVVLSDEHDGYKWLEISHNASNEMYKPFKERMMHWNWDMVI